MFDFNIFYQAAQALLHGISPYTVPGFFSPIWALIPFLPLTLFPQPAAEALYALMTIAGTLWALVRFRLKPLTLIAIVLFSPLVWINLLTANVDWIVLLGATFSPTIGAWLCGMKPQMSFGVFCFWAYQKRWKTILPIGIALVANYAIFGMPRLNTYNNGMAGLANGFAASLFPIGIPIALSWFYRSVKQNNTGLALALSAMCSPYYSFSSTISLAPLAKTKKGTILVLVLSWLLFIMYKFAIRI